MTKSRKNKPPANDVSLAKKKRVPTKDELAHRFADGLYGSVWLYDEAYEEYQALCDRNDQTSTMEKATLSRYFPRFADTGPTGFQGDMLKSQGRFPDDDGKQKQVYAFKAYQFRIYGLIENHFGKPSFVGTTCDPSKKSNLADTAKLKKAALMSGRVRK